MKNTEQEQVFASNVKKSNYSFKDLLFYRKKYYILCIALIVVSGTCTGISFGLRNQKSYDNYSSFKVADIKSQFNMDQTSPNEDGVIENDYYVYNYSDTCTACDNIKLAIFNYIEKVASFSDPALLYLLNVQELYYGKYNGTVDTDIDQYKNLFIGLSNEEEMRNVLNTYLFKTPTMFHISNAKIAEVFVGDAEITSALSLLDYSQYRNIDQVTAQLSQSSEHYYIYYYNNLTESRKYKQQILEFVDGGANGNVIYFANAEYLGIIDKSISENYNDGQTISTSIRVSSLPYMVEVNNKEVKASYIGFDSIMAKLNSNE